MKSDGKARREARLRDQPCDVRWVDLGLRTEGTAMCPAGVWYEVRHVERYGSVPDATDRARALRYYGHEAQVYTYTVGAPPGSRASGFVDETCLGPVSRRAR